MLDFFAGKIGAYFYHRGLYDVQAALSRKIDDIQDAILQREQATSLQR